MDSVSPIRRRNHQEYAQTTASIRRRIRLAKRRPALPDLAKPAALCTALLLLSFAGPSFATPTLDGQPHRIAPRARPYAILHTLADRVAFGMQTIRRLHIPKAITEAMRQLPRSLVVPHNHRSDHAVTLHGHPNMSNPIDVATVLKEVLTIPRGGHVLELGTGIYGTALLLRLAAHRGATVTTAEIDRNLLHKADAAIDQLKRTGNIPAHARWRPYLGDAMNALQLQNRLGQLDRIAFQFALTHDQLPTLVHHATTLLNKAGRLIVPVAQSPTDRLQDLLIVESSGAIRNTGATVSFELEALHEP